MRLVGCVWLLTALAAASPQRITIGFGHVPPISYKDSRGQAAGFAIDVLNEAARRAGVELQWRGAGNSRDTEAALLSGKLDMVPAAMVTPYRQKNLYVSEPWWFAELTLLAPAASHIESGSQLAGKRLALSTPIYGTLLERFFPPLTAVPFTNSADALNAVCRGEATAALIAHSELREFLLQRPGACQDTALYAVNTSARMDLAIMAHPRCGPIAERLRERIDEMALDGTLAALAERRPALPAWGAVRLADELRARYERKTLRITLISTAALLMLAALYLLARIRTQRILAANEQRYRTFFYQAAAGTAEVDPEGRLLDLNETCCRIIGRAREEVIGRNVEELCYPEDRERTREAFRALVAGELPAYNMEKRYLHSDGSPVWVRVAASAVRDRGGRTLYVVGVVQDISARKRAEEALRQSEERYRTLVEANPVGVAFVSIRGDDYGRLYKVNQAYADMIGYTRDEIESGGVRWTDLTPEEWAQADRLAIEETSRNGHSRLYEKEYIRKDGTRVPILLACAAHGENGAAVTFVLDVSDRKRLEREVKWLSGLLPICASCKSVRDENGNWQPVDSYMHHRIAADFTHGLCPTCLPLYGGRPAE